MGENVKWTGIFAVIDDYLILQGEVRSLFFNFDSRKVVSNIIDLPVKQDEIQDLNAHPKVQNVLNMTLYTFGKWGAIKGLKVEQDYAQLNHLFGRILGEIYVEPGYSRENFRFYKEGIRITYEDVIQLMLEAQNKPVEEPEKPEEEKQGLWHKLIWMKKPASISMVETTLAERQKERLGHNFYMVGYLCPKCKEKLHMVVFPANHELLVDTEEGRVYLARAYACDKCNCFYTPRPEKLLAEGDNYEMAFAADRKAYEDYLELLGEKGEHTSNYNFNEYEMVRKAKEKQKERLAETRGESEQTEQEEKDVLLKKEAVDEMTGLCAKLSRLPELDFARLKARIEEGFFPFELIKKHEKQIKEQTVEREKRKKEQREKNFGDKNGEERIPQKEKEQSGFSINSNTNATKSDQTNKEKFKNALMSDQRLAEQTEKKGADSVGIDAKKEHSTSGKERNQQLISEKIDKYQTKVQLWKRLSPRQRQEFIHQVQQDKDLNESEKEMLLEPIRKQEREQKQADFEQKANQCEKFNYVQTKRVIEEIESADLPEEWKEGLLGRLRGLLQQKGNDEVKQLMEHMPANLDRRGYKALAAQLKEYQDVDIAPYQKELSEKREAVETQEIKNLVNRARKNSREDLVALMRRLQEEEFAPETLAPYEEKLKEKIKEYDEKTIAELCDGVHQMSFDEAAEAYEKIEKGDFLPELKVNAVEMLTKRLAKIKTDESELLVHKLQEEMNGKIKENPRHHFYPARKVLMKEASAEETQVIDYALGTYATKRKLFEYPILVVDTSRNESGKEGIILTPEHIFYSTLLSAYEIPVSSIKSIKSNTGLIGRGITVEQKNGVKTKIPYAVDTSELKNWAEVLADFIAYLQEKPESRDVTYLAKEKHETICCFRCGYTYKGGNVCPKCGYKMNQ